MESNGLLCATVKTSNCQVTEFLLKLDGIDVNYIDEHKKFPLYYAYENNMIGQMKLLIAHGANVNQKYYSHTVLNRECRKFVPSLEMIKLLMDNEADPNIITDESTDCDLKHLGKIQNADCISLLLSYPRTNINLVGSKITPFRFVCVNDYNVSAILLLDKGCDPNIVGNDKKTVLMRCVENKNALMSSVLLSRDDVKLDLQDDGGNSALHHACKMSDATSIYQLLSRNVDQTSKNKDGKTAFDCCATGNLKWIFTNFSQKKIQTNDTTVTDEKSTSTNNRCRIYLETPGSSKIKYGFIYH